MRKHMLVASSVDLSVVSMKAGSRLAVPLSNVTGSNKNGAYLRRPFGCVARENCVVSGPHRSLITLMVRVGVGIDARGAVPAGTGLSGRRFLEKVDPGAFCTPMRSKMHAVRSRIKWWEPFSPAPGPHTSIGVVPSLVPGRVIQV